MSENAVLTGRDSAIPVSTVTVILPNGEGLDIPRREVSMAGDVSGDLTSVTMDRLGKIIAGLQQVLEPIGQSALPGKTKLEVSLELSVEAGKLTALLVDGNIKGNVKLSFEWTKS